MHQADAGLLGAWVHRSLLTEVTMGFFDSIGGFVKDIGGSLLKGVVGGFGDLPSLAASSALSMFGADRASDQAKENAEEAFNRSQKAYGERYQTTISDMRKAGLNPILASSGGFSVGNAPTMAAAPAYQMHSPTIIPASQSAKNVQETSESESREKLNFQKINESVAQVDKVFNETELIRTQHGKVWQETKNLVAELEKIYADTQLAQQRTIQSIAEVHLLREQRKETIAMTNQINANLSKLNQISEIYKGPLGPALATIHEVTNAIGAAILGGAAGALTGRRR